MSEIINKEDAWRNHTKLEVETYIKNQLESLLQPKYRVTCVNDYDGNSYIYFLYPGQEIIIEDIIYEGVADQQMQIEWAYYLDDNYNVVYIYSNFSRVYDEETGDHIPVYMPEKNIRILFKGYVPQQEI